VTVIGTGTSSYEVIKLTETKYPDIAVIDYQLDCGGPDIVSLVRRRSPGTSIILISSSNDSRRAVEALSSGASAYLLRKSDMDILGSIIYVVREGGHYISWRIMARIFQTLPVSLRMGGTGQKVFPGGAGIPGGYGFPLLGQGETRVLELIGRGKGTKEIGETLNLKSGTVRNYISGLMRKTGAQNRQELLRFARNRGRPRAAALLRKNFSPLSRPMEKIPPRLEASLNLES
jgi:DNA-binding NarL/FixJ family response regulator